MASSTTIAEKSAKTAKSVTAYAQIEGRLRRKIREGEWPAGAMLPSRRDLAREYGVSSLTVDRAVSHLIAEGLLRADDRRGTFVTRPEATETDKVSGTLETIFGRETGAVTPLTVKTTPATVGIIAPLYVYSNDHHELHNFWMRLLLHLLEQDLSGDGKTTHFFNQIKAPNQPPVPLSEAIAEARASGIDALAVVAFSFDPKDVDSDLAPLLGGGIPVVCVTIGPLVRPIPHVFYDGVSAGYDAASHLLQRGYTDIRYFSPFRSAWVSQRLEGIRAAVEHASGSASLQVVPESVPVWILDNDPETSGYEAAGAVLDAGIAGAGVVCANDGIAVGLLRAAAERGLTAGTDFGLVGFDDRPDARTLGLTTMRPPMEEIGKEMARLLSRAMQGEKTDLQVRLRSHLIPRRTTKVSEQ